MEGSANMRILIALGIIGLFGIITFALAAATLGTLNKRYDNLDSQIKTVQNQISALGDNSSTTTTHTLTSTTPSTTTTSTTTSSAVNSTTSSANTTSTTTFTTTTSTTTSTTTTSTTTSTTTTSTTTSTTTTT
ncbi:unnamed protein product [Adineta steineri]|uniref:Uncharacterized protein n=1 Tax=Adineta steineri TaxID=433720 RepID=A0A819TWY9_9BILA|nr:unnamed protein product [Adineta steineri]CAF4087956.1 unnamed protein product [Adineta steineri]